MLSNLLIYSFKIFLSFLAFLKSLSYLSTHQYKNIPVVLNMIHRINVLWSEMNIREVFVLQTSLMFFNAVYPIINNEEWIAMLTVRFLIIYIYFLSCWKEQSQLLLPQQCFLKTKLSTFITAGERNEKAIYNPFWKCGIRNMRQYSCFSST